MGKTIDFYWDLGSTNSYFALHLIKPVAKKHSATVVPHPFNLGYVFRKQNYVLMEEPKVKLRSRKIDLMRWAKKYDLPFEMPKKFPMKTSPALRGALAMRRFGKEWEYMEKIFGAYWERNDASVGELAGLKPIAAELGVDQAEFEKLVESDEYPRRAHRGNRPRSRTRRVRRSDLLRRRRDVLGQGPYGVHRRRTDLSHPSARPSLFVHGGWLIDMAFSEFASTRLHSNAPAQFSWDDPFLLDQQLTEDERMIRDTARDYAREKLLPRVTEAYLNEETDREIFREMGALGLIGVTFPEEFGCAGAGYVSYGLVAREIERVDSGYRSMISVQSSLSDVSHLCLWRRRATQTLPAEAGHRRAGSVASVLPNPMRDPTPAG